MKINHKSGFTLVELLAVISIIGFLSSVVFVSLNSARAKARDARRSTDLNQVAVALRLYYEKNGNWIETGSGCGYNGGGNGWFNYVGGTSYIASISSCLQNQGFIPAEIIDPTGGKTSSPSSGFTYMKYHCGSAGELRQVYLYAKFETISQSSTALDGTCCPTCDSSYGMNYFYKVN